ncbi:MAG TPA: DUF2927 domain-containing protein [Ohtaekwangia sp.]
MPSVKKTALWIMCLGALSACSGYDTESEHIRPLTPYQSEVIAYFKEIALGFEYGSAPQIIYKWKSPMRVFVGGQKHNTILRDELQKVIAEINQLATDGFFIEVTDDTLRSNCYIFLGSRTEFLERFPDAATSLGSNYGLFNVWQTHGEIHKARIFVDAVRPLPHQQRSTLREELTQSLGLGRDCPQYQNSIFYEAPGDGGFNTAYAKIDKDIIRLLYHPVMPAGLEKGFLNLVLIKFYQQENSIN